MTDDERAATQRKIADAVRGAMAQLTQADAKRSADTMIAQLERDGMPAWAVFVAIVLLDQRTNDALRQVMQGIDLN